MLPFYQMLHFSQTESQTKVYHTLFSPKPRERLIKTSMPKVNELRLLFARLDFENNLSIY